MKISELTAFRELLSQIKPKSLIDSVRGDLDPVLHAVKNNRIKLLSMLSALEVEKDIIIIHLQKFLDQIDKIDDSLLRQIESLESKYFADSYRLYDAMCTDPLQHVLDRRFTISADDLNYVQSRVQANSNWQSPGMIIRPGLETLIEHMVACDPLYVVDTSHDLLQPTKDKFNPVYQNRLRYYVINEGLDREMMCDLPDEQFGFCLAYNFFHYKPLEIMRCYLHEINRKLRPGGVLCFTFNDCDRSGAVTLAENCFTCYTPGRLIYSLCESLDFTVRQKHDISAAVTWVELTKPGSRASIRGGQSLAKTIAKS